MSEGICAVDGCGRERHYRNPYCKSHDRRWRKTGDPGPAFTSRAKGLCSVRDCGRPHQALGYCIAHRQRLAKTGRLDPERPVSKWKGADISYRGAHSRMRWLRGSPSQYPCEQCGGTAKDWAYDHKDPHEQMGEADGSLMAFSGDPAHYIPLCGPCHRKLDQSHRLTCRKGHPYDAANTYVNPTTGGRHCRTCAQYANWKAGRYRTGPTPLRPPAERG